ncbi:MAG: hypothetical protein EOO36_05615 [Cytophagaceae bacterium]|nr:MAG: hypothetical protein EOO36_05615 [Cytophagaceae bacterium]
MKKLLLSAGLLAGFYPAAAQWIATSDTSLLQSAVRAARQRYQAAAPDSRLLNGVAYGNKAPAYVRGRPFFQSSDPQLGTLDYDGQHFAGVALLYEQVHDQVLLYGAAQAEPVQLIRQKVGGFELAGHRFVHLPADAAGGVAEGYYDVVVAGPTQLLAKRAKKLEASTGGYGLKGEYEEITRFFIQRPTGFYEVATLRQVLAALPDKQTELQAHARRNHLQLTTDGREASLASLVQEYNALMNN